MPRITALIESEIMIGSLWFRPALAKKPGSSRLFACALQCQKCENTGLLDPPA
jgi:hypothetical protein